MQLLFRSRHVNDLASYLTLKPAGGEINEYKAHFVLSQVKTAERFTRNKEHG